MKKRRTRGSAFKDAKIVRALAAALRVPYDQQTKLLLIAYLAHVSSKRPDWAVWPGERTLAELSSCRSHTTVVNRRKRLEDDGVLVRRPRHVKQKSGWRGRPAFTYTLDIHRLERLADGKDVLTATPHSGRRKMKTTEATTKQVRPPYEDLFGGGMIVFPRHWGLHGGRDVRTLADDELQHTHDWCVEEKDNGWHHKGGRTVGEKILAMVKREIRRRKVGRREDEERFNAQQDVLEAEARADGRISWDEQVEERERETLYQMVAGAGARGLTVEEVLAAKDIPVTGRAAGVWENDLARLVGEGRVRQVRQRYVAEPGSVDGGARASEVVRGKP